MAIAIHIDSTVGTDLRGLLFVKSALTRDKTDKRPHMNLILISCGYAIGTDGRRLHRYKLQRKCKPGLYRVVAAKAGKNGEIVLIREKRYTTGDYPKWKQVFPNRRELLATVDFRKKAKCNWTDVGVGVLPVMFRYLYENKQGFNVSYIADLPTGLWTAGLYPERRMVLFHQGDMSAVVMTMRM